MGQANSIIAATGEARRLCQVGRKRSDGRPIGYDRGFGLVFLHFAAEPASPDRLLSQSAQGIARETCRSARVKVSRGRQVAAHPPRLGTWCRAKRCATSRNRSRLAADRDAASRMQVVRSISRKPCHRDREDLPQVRAIGDRSKPCGRCSPSPSRNVRRTQRVMQWYQRVTEGSIRCARAMVTVRPPRGTIKVTGRIQRHLSSLIRAAYRGG